MSEIPISLVWETAAIPVAVSLVGVWLLGRVAWIAAARGAVSLALAFIIGWSMQEWAELTPERYIDWLPYAAGALGAVAIVSARVPRVVAWLLAIAVCILVAWKLVPDFPKLQPPHAYACIIVAASSIVLMIATQRVSSRIPPRLITLALMATGTAGAIVLAQSFGMKLAQTTGILTAGLAGSLIFAGGDKQREPLGLSIVFLPLLCNVMFMGYATSSSEVPLFCYGLVPAAPLALWTASRSGDDSDDQQPRRRGRTAIACVALLVVLSIAVAAALLAHPPWEETQLG